MVAEAAAVWRKRHEGDEQRAVRAADWALSTLRQPLLESTQIHTHLCELHVGHQL